MQPLFRRRNPLLRVEAGWAADDDQVHRPVLEETTQLVVGRRPGARREALRFLARAPAHRHDAHAFNRRGGRRMGVADVARADQADVDHRVAAKALNS